MENQIKVFSPSLQNKTLMEAYLKYNRYRGCGFTVSNPIMWGENYNTMFTIIKENLCFCYMKDDYIRSFSFPIGKGGEKESFDEIRKYFEEKGLPFSMNMVEPEMFAQIEEWYPDEYFIEYDRASADYLYETRTLTKLSGKKLHGKRNHINRFLENHPDYVYETINEDNINECLWLAKEWSKEREDMNQEDDSEVLDFALRHFKELGLNGALIKVDGEIIAFTAGRRVTDDTYDVHFEKANQNIQGAYTMINREFVARELQDYRYINREEDMGLPGLRHAKTSYQPIKLIDKGHVRRKKDVY